MPRANRDGGDRPVVESLVGSIRSHQGTAGGDETWAPNRLGVNDQSTRPVAGSRASSRASPVSVFSEVTKTRPSLTAAEPSTTPIVVVLQSMRPEVTSIAEMDRSRAPTYT